MAKPSLFGKHVHVILDIGYSSVKIAQVGGGNILLVDVALIPPVDNEERRKYEILKAVRTLLNNYKIKQNTIDLVISDPSVYVRLMKVKESEVDINATVNEAMELMVPYGTANAQINHFIIGETTIGPERLLEIMAVSVLKKVLKSSADLIGKLGLNTRSIQLSPLAMQSFNRKNLSTETHQEHPVVIYIDFGARKTEVNIMEHGVLKLSRNLQIGGQTLTNHIANELGVSFSNAEMLKIQFAIATDQVSKKKRSRDQEALVQNTLAPIFQEIAVEIERTITAYQSFSAGTNIARVYLCGGGSKIKNLAEFLGKMLNLPVDMLRIEHQTAGAEMLENVQDPKQTRDNTRYFNLVLGAPYLLDDDKANFFKSIKQSRLKKPIAMSTPSTSKSSTMLILKRWSKYLKNYKIFAQISGRISTRMDSKKMLIIGGAVIVLGVVLYVLFLNFTISRLSDKYSGQKVIYNEYLEKANKVRFYQKKIDEIKSKGISTGPALQINPLLSKINQKA
ncbi:MAG: pilus assembly protein PilM, partial [Candidatus Margulisiibacteriota bacterium]